MLASLLTTRIFCKTVPKQLGLNIDKYALDLTYTLYLVYGL